MYLILGSSKIRDFRRSDLRVKSSSSYLPLAFETTGRGRFGRRILKRQPLNPAPALGPHWRFHRQQKTGSSCVETNKLIHCQITYPIVIYNEQYQR